MADELRPFRLGDYCRKIGSGATPRGGKDAYLPSGPFSLIRSQNIYNDRFSVSGLAYISQEQANALKAVEVLAGDVLVNITGDSVARVCQVDPGVLPARVNQHVAIVRPDNEHIDAGFLRYWFVTRDTQSSLLALASAGATRPALTKAMLENLEIPRLSIDDQRAIASVLATLDEKIELNRRMNETLEGMAQAIFRDWFVDFGPTRRKAAGEADPVAIMGGLTPDPAGAAELAALFPAAFGNGVLPVGWTERPLDAIAGFLNGLALQKFPAKGGEPDLPVIKIAELRNGLSERTNRASRLLPTKYIIKDGDLIFSWSGSLMAKVWTLGEGALNQHLFKVWSDEFPQWFYGQWVHHHMPEFQLIAASKATTMGHIQRGHLSSATTVCPQDGAMEVMSSVMQPLWDRMIHNELESRTLAETRDYLLPRLMSGAVHVAPKAEAA